jgi:hypothetical protein
VYSNELPARLIEQVTMIGSRTFLAIKESHHLSTGAGAKKKKKKKVMPSS